MWNYFFHGKHKICQKQLRKLPWCQNFNLKEQYNKKYNFVWVCVFASLRKLPLFLKSLPCFYVLNTEFLSSWTKQQI